MKMDYFKNDFPGSSQENFPPISKNAAREHELQTLPITDKQNLWGGSNTVYLLTYEGGSKGIFKPGPGEDTLWEFSESHYRLYRRERAGYLVSDRVGFDVVPATIIRSVKNERHILEEGSVQDFVTDPKSVFWERPDNNEQLGAGYFGIAIYDYFIWNKDRKGGNLFFKGNKLIAPDNGLSFDAWPQYLITNNLYNYVVYQSIPAELRKNIGEFIENRKRCDSLRQELTSLVPSRTIDAMFQRIRKTDKLLSKGVITWEDLEELSYYPRI